MINLLSGELYKWKKSKSFVACLAAAIAMVFLIYGMIIVAMQIQKGAIANGTGGVVVTSSVSETDEELGILDVVSEVTAGEFGIMFVCIFVCIWVVSEYNNGAVKNIVGKGYSRAKVFLAKHFSSVVSATVMNIIIFAVMVLTGFVILGTNDVNAGFFKDLFSYIGIQLMLSIALISIIVCVCEFTRNMAAGIAVSMAILMFSTMVSGGLNLLFAKLNLDIKATEYWILDVIFECPMGAIDMDFVGRGISVTVMWTVLSLVIGMVHFRRADIK